jgi:Protein of unknown function (DUF2721)
MLEELLRADRLSQVIDHTTAPAFLLGAVAGFLAIMLARVENLTRRIDDGKVHAVHDLAQVKRRIRLLNWAVFFAICAAIAAAVLVIAAFAFAFLNLPHVYGVGTLFTVSFTLLTVALLLFAQEIRLAIKGNDRIG